MKPVVARIPEHEIERLKEEVSLQRLVELAGVELKRQGKDLVGCCPFHDDRTPSLVISPQKARGAAKARFTIATSPAQPARRRSEIAEGSTARGDDLAPNQPFVRIEDQHRSATRTTFSSRLTLKNPTQVRHRMPSSVPEPQESEPKEIEPSFVSSM